MTLQLQQKTNNTSWVKLSSNVHGDLQSYVKDESLGRQQFGAVFTALGTNDVLKVTAHQSRWHQLEDAINIVARLLKDYLVKDARVKPASSEHPSTTGVPIYITSPFCFETNAMITCSKSCCRGFARSRACISLVSSGIRQPIVRSRQRRQINTSMSVECTCWLRACVVFALLCHQKFLVAMSSRQHQVA